MIIAGLFRTHAYLTCTPCDITHTSHINSSSHVVCSSFESFRDGGELQLEWTELHLQYVDIAETQISEALQAHGVTTAELYTVLNDAADHAQSEAAACADTHRCEDDY